MHLPALGIGSSRASLRRQLLIPAISLLSRHLPSHGNMAVPEHSDVTENKSHSHNPSAQHNVEKNNDPALDTTNEHTHAHLHHSARAERGRDQTEYSKGTTYEHSNIPSQDPHDQTVHRSHSLDGPGPKVPAVADTEKGNLSPDNRSDEDPRTPSFYQKYRIYFHLFIWLLFTGSVYIPHKMMCFRSIFLKIHRLT